MNNYEPSLYNTYMAIAEKQHRNKYWGVDGGGIIYIAAGMGYNPIDTAYKEFADQKYYEIPGYETAVYNTWLKHQEEVMQHIATLPTHAEFLAKYIYKVDGTLSWSCGKYTIGITGDL